MTVLKKKKKKAPLPPVEGHSLRVVYEEEGEVCINFLGGVPSDFRSFFHMVKGEQLPSLDVHLGQFWGYTYREEPTKFSISISGKFYITRVTGEWTEAGTPTSREISGVHREWWRSNLGPAVAFDAT